VKLGAALEIDRHTLQLSEPCRHHGRQSACHEPLPLSTCIGQHVSCVCALQHPPHSHACHVASQSDSRLYLLLRLYTLRELIRASLCSTRSERNQLFCRWRQSNVWGNGADGGRPRGAEGRRGGRADGRRGEGARKIGGVTEGMGDYLPRFGSADGAQAHASRLSASRCAAAQRLGPGPMVTTSAPIFGGEGEKTWVMKVRQTEREDRLRVKVRI